MHDTRARQSVVLIIEDDTDSASRCEALVESVGATSLRVNSLESAEKILTQNAPDVVIVDYDLPDGTGIDVIAAVRQSMVHRSTPIVLLTGDIYPAELERAVMMGIYAFLAKPFSGQEFVKLLNAAINENADRVPRTNG
ncbi:MAG: response regulator [Planctomycetes bacterium]|nr:response regulator [Planctomycetota bacterium]